MTRLRLAKSDHHYLLFAELYEKLTEPKSKRKAFSVLEAAISCYAKKGFDSVTLDLVAREAGVTRSLLLHYFENAEDLRNFSIKYIRLLFQKLVLRAIPTDGTADRMLEAYVRACFAWVRQMRAHSLVWLAFLHRCGGAYALRELNTLAAATGEDRISNLLLKGQTDGVFAFGDTAGPAKAIQAVITGALVMMASENIENVEAFENQTCELCLLAARGRHQNSI